MNKNEFVCPNCGANLVVNENVKNMKAKERIEALKAAGIDVTNLFAIANNDGEEHVAKNEGGVLVVIADNDPIFQKIMEQGDVNNRHLFRRWVMSQTFHLLVSVERYGNVTEMISFRGYNYQWKMLKNEMYAQMKMFGKDNENFIARCRWFNTNLIIKMMQDYLLKIEKHWDGLSQKKCKGVPYKTLNGNHIFVEDFYKKVVSPVNKLISSLLKAKSLREIYKIVCKFCEVSYNLPYNTTMCKEWVDAFKGCGAYYTMQNLIRFHGCFIRKTNNGWTNDQSLNKSDSLRYLDAIAEEHKTEGWRLFGIMKEFIQYNGIDIEKSIENWRKR